MHILLALLAAVGVAYACEAPPKVVSVQVDEPIVWHLERETLEHPLMRYPILEVPNPGTVEELSGNVFLQREDERIPLHVGDRVGDGALVEVPAGSSVTVRFTASVKLSVEPDRRMRWFELHVVQGE